MIKEIKGNLLECNGVLAHQVNCKGVMGAGVAKQVKKILAKDEFGFYQIMCKQPASQLLGGIMYSTTIDGRIVANMFAENIPTGTGLDTDYKALEKCFKSLERFARKKNAPIFIPGYIGCGLAGGDWDHVYNNIIVPIFKSSRAKLTIVYLPESVQLLWNDFMHVMKDYETGEFLESWHGFKEGTMADHVISWFAETFDVDPVDLNA